MVLSKRQQLIYDFISSKNSVTRLEIEDYVKSVYENVSKVTVLRDLSVLIDNHYIEKFNISFRMIN